MGQIVHRAVIVSGWDDQRLADAHMEADALGLPVSPIVRGRVVSCGSFMVAPDGSKEGWETSDTMKAARQRFIAYLREAPSLSWASVEFGEVARPHVVADEGSYNDD